MKIKLDENLPDRLVPFLTALGHNVDTTGAEQLTGHPDLEVCNAAQAARFLITQDLDFSDMRQYTAGTHAGLLIMRLTRPGRGALFDRVSAVFQTEQVEDWKGCLVVATDQKVRVRRPARPNYSRTARSQNGKGVGRHTRRAPELNARRIPSSTASSSLAKSSARKRKTR